ncbi:hypothetical protein E1B28_003822 [Marasmius oreades]|uniref:F-box domain-containing protein n=1 Tax=Marasmius oreades TaxID=181124 RepID=A0A9P7UXH0_9AGAR|nr:uncharacterized protein E1B28_003822 [Marasmius oreades]KAG7096378.1 hypothetical protein E1B28_003822 [Marasmius oreades]
MGKKNFRVDMPPEDTRPKLRRLKRARLTSVPVQSAQSNFSWHGLLDRLVKDMPLDIVVEISAYLQPLDLLSLSRTNRDLRTFLTSRSSEIVWRSARANAYLSLPPILEDLDEPSYASLAFDATCYVCRRPCQRIIWELRVCCHPDKCESGIFFTIDDLPEQLPHYATELKELGELTDVSFQTRESPKCSSRQQPSRIPFYTGVQKHNDEGMAMTYCKQVVEQHCREYVKVKHDAEKLEKWRSSREEYYNAREQ